MFEALIKNGLISLDILEARLNLAASSGYAVSCYETSDITIKDHFIPVALYIHNPEELKVEKVEILSIVDRRTNDGFNESHLLSQSKLMLAKEYIKTLEFSRLDLTKLFITPGQYRFQFSANVSILDSKLMLYVIKGLR